MARCDDIVQDIVENRRVMRATVTITRWRTHRPSPTPRPARRFPKPTHRIPLRLPRGPSHTRPRLSIPLTTAFGVVADRAGPGDATPWRKLRTLARSRPTSNAYSRPTN